MCKITQISPVVNVFILHMYYEHSFLSRLDVFQGESMKEEYEELFDLYIKYIIDVMIKKIMKERGHTKRVFKLCKSFLEEYEDSANVRKGLLLKSAILHDIAKFDEGKKKKNHNSPKLVKAAMMKASISINDKNEMKHIYNIIKAHKGEFKPKPNNAMEAAILRICDKLDRYYKGNKDAEDKCKESILEIKDYFNNNKIDEFDEFETAYSNVLKKVKKKIKNDRRLP